MTLDLADRLAIHETLARLDHAVDAGDWNAYLAHYADDATLDPGFAPPVSGRDAIRAFLVATEGNTRGKRHVASNVFVDGSTTNAVATSYLVVIEREDIPKIIATAVIVDTFARRDGQWKVVHHKVAIDPGMFKAFAQQQSG